MSIFERFFAKQSSQKTSPIRNRRLALESLESRELLSVAPDFLFSFWGAINANTNKQDFDFGSYSSNSFDSSVANTYGEVNVSGSVVVNNNQLTFQSQISVEKAYSDADVTSWISTIGTMNQRDKFQFGYVRTTMYNISSKLMSMVA